jgi:hypothetical protein
MNTVVSGQSFFISFRHQDYTSVTLQNYLAKKNVYSLEWDPNIVMLRIKGVELETRVALQWYLQNKPLGTMFIPKTNIVRDTLTIDNLVGINHKTITEISNVLQDLPCATLVYVEYIYVAK